MEKSITNKEIFNEFKKMINEDLEKNSKKLPANKNLISVIRFRNKNKNRLFCEIVFDNQTAISLYSLIYGFCDLHKKKGFNNFKIALQNYLLTRGICTIEEIKNIEAEVKLGFNFFHKSKCKKALELDVKKIKKLNNIK